MELDENALLPFQREGVAAGADRFHGKILIGDEMGLGKTMQAIALACRYRHEWPLLVLCPTSMALPWADELEKWCPFLRPGDINLVRSHHNGALTTAPVTILSYGLVTNGKEKERLMASVHTAGFNVCVADEAHYLKNRDAVRTKLILPVLARSRRCVLLTGTPALSRPVELFTLLSTLRPEVPQWRTYTAFVTRFCDAQSRIVGRGGARRFDVSGCSNSTELHELLVQHVMVRRRKADVLSQLPAKRRQRILLTLTGGRGGGGGGGGGGGASASAQTGAAASSGAALAELRQLEKQMQSAATQDEFARRTLLSSMCTVLGEAKAHAAAEYVLEVRDLCERRMRRRRSGGVEHAHTVGIQRGGRAKQRRPGAGPVGASRAMLPCRRKHCIMCPARASCAHRRLLCDTPIISGWRTARRCCRRATAARRSSLPTTRQCWMLSARPLPPTASARSASTGARPLRSVPRSARNSKRCQRVCPPSSSSPSSPPARA